MNRLFHPLSLSPLFLTALGLVGCGGCGSPPQPAADRKGPPDEPAKPANEPARPAAAKGPRLGVNLAAVNDWSREWPFVDVFKSSRPWFTTGDGKVEYDDHGNPLPKPGRPAQTLMVRELDGHYPGGAYVATYEGAGKVEMSRWDVGRVVKSAPGRVEVEVKPGDGGLQLEITEADPKDPVRNVHVWMPGKEKADSPFHPLFRERLKPFGVLRFMDWQRTNNSTTAKWSPRPTPDDARYSTDAGVPLEVMIDLANACKADPWFCMPHLADDEYVREFARVVKGRLDPGLKVYVEYSNEVWNGQFAQTRWAQEQGRKLKLGDPEGLRFYARRSVEAFKIWEEVFGGTDRLVRVLGGQFANPWVSEQVLSWEDAGKHADALAVAPYFGNRFGDPKTADDVAKLTVDRLLDELNDEVKGPSRETMQKQAETAAKYHVALIAYEGGQHLAGFAGAENNEALTNLFLAANRHPRMYDLYREHLKNWSASGGGLYVAYSNVARPGKWGCWGALEYQDQPAEAAPKYRALIDFGKDAGRSD
jgi:hypothetical protein